MGKMEHQGEHFSGKIKAKCLARCTSLISSSSSLGRDIQNCRPFELLVNKCEDIALLFLTTHPQGHLWVQLRPPEAVYMEVGSS